MNTMIDTPHIRIVINFTRNSDVIDTVNTEFGKYTSVNEIENKLFDLVISIYNKHCTYKDEISSALLSYGKFTQPEVYIDGIRLYYSTLPQYLINVIGNVNLRRLQWVLNHQYTNCTFPTDRAIRDSDEWTRYGGSVSVKPRTDSEIIQSKCESIKKWNETPWYKKILGMIYYH